MHVVQFDPLIKNMELICCQHLAFPMGVTWREERRRKERRGGEERRREERRGEERRMLEAWISLDSLWKKKKEGT